MLCHGQGFMDMRCSMVEVFVDGLLLLPIYVTGLMSLMNEVLPVMSCACSCCPAFSPVARSHYVLRAISSPATCLICASTGNGVSRLVSERIFDDSLGVDRLHPVFR